MIESQIADGDYVVISKQETADNGEKVVAMVDKAMTLKKFYQRKDHIGWSRATATMPAIRSTRQRRRAVLGVLVGVIRKC